MLTVEKPLEFVAIPEDIRKQYKYSTPEWAIISHTAKEYKTFSYKEGLSHEPVIQRFSEDHWVTVNRYGARCLNSRTLFMADADLLEGYADRSWLFKALTRAISQFLADDDVPYRFEIYHTFAGIRVLETSREYYAPYLSLDTHGSIYGAASEKSVLCHEDSEKNLRILPSGKQLLEKLSNDLCYQTLCFQQGCYRHRLDPKPWRVDHEWRVSYRRIVMGDAPRNPALAPLLEAYDRQVLGE